MRKLRHREAKDLTRPHSYWATELAQAQAAWFPSSYSILPLTAHTCDAAGRSRETVPAGLSSTPELNLKALRPLCSCSTRETSPVCPGFPCPRQRCVADEPLALTACFLRAVSKPEGEVRTGWVPVGGGGGGWGGEHRGPVTRAGGGGAGSRRDVSCGLGDELCGEPAWGAAPPFQELSVGREGVCIGASQHGLQVGRKQGAREAGSPWVGTEGHKSLSGEEPDGAGSAVSHKTRGRRLDCALPLTLWAASPRASVVCYTK